MSGPQRRRRPNLIQSNREHPGSTRTHPWLTGQHGAVAATQQAGKDKPIIRYALVGFAAVTLLSTTLIPDDAFARVVRGGAGGYRGAGAVGVRGGGYRAAAIRGGRYGGIWRSLARRSLGRRGRGGSRGGGRRGLLTAT